MQVCDLAWGMHLKFGSGDPARKEESQKNRKTVAAAISEEMFAKLDEQLCS